MSDCTQWLRINSALLEDAQPSCRPKEIEKVLKVPVIQVSLYGTDLIGIFAVASDDAVLIPEIVFPSELKHLKEKLAKHKIAVHTIKTEHTALAITCCSMKKQA